MRKQVRCNQRYHTPLKKELVATSVSGVNMNKKLFFKKQKRKKKKTLPKLICLSELNTWI